MGSDGLRGGTWTFLTLPWAQRGPAEQSDPPISEQEEPPPRPGVSLTLAPSHTPFPGVSGASRRICRNWSQGGPWGQGVFPAVSASARTGSVLCAGITENGEAGNTARSHTHRSPESVARGRACGHPGSVCAAVGGRAHRNAATPGCDVRAIISPASGSEAFLSPPLAEWLSITPGSQHGFPPQRGFSFSPAAIFRGLGSADLPPSNDLVAWPGWDPWPPTQSQARPCWGHGGGQAPLPDSGDTRRGWQEPAQAGCSVCFRTKAVSLGPGPETRCQQRSLSGASSVESQCKLTLGPCHLGVPRWLPGLPGAGLEDKAGNRRPDSKTKFY